MAWFVVRDDWAHRCKIGVFDMRNLASRIVTLLLCLVLSMGALALVGCGGGNDNAAPQQGTDQQAGGDEQDNCFGDDLPVVNETE